MLEISKTYSIVYKGFLKFASRFLCWQGFLGDSTKELLTRSEGPPEIASLPPRGSDKVYVYSTDFTGS